jgi:Uncharacterized protein conserved in bacteria (DUF2330)
VSRRAALWSAAAALAAATALAFASAPAGACACGIAIDATVSEESALVVERPGGERIVLSLDLASDGSERAAVVLPVPGTPEVTAIDDGDPLAYLDLATQPEPAVGSSAGGGGDTSAAPGVDVIGRDRIGGYDVARLASGDPAALDRWLADNGYSLPDGAEPILADYVTEGWRFVAIRLAPGAEGRLKPLSLDFETEETIYPMRLAQLSSVPIAITLYTLADGPRTTQWLSEAWSGEVGELSPPPPDELAELFAEGSWVTRLEGSGLDPSTFNEDLVVEAAPVAATSGATAVAETPELISEQDSGISTGGVIALIVAGLAFALALAVATRR